MSAPLADYALSLIDSRLQSQYIALTRHCSNRPSIYPGPRLCAVLYSIHERGNVNDMNPHKEFDLRVHKFVDKVSEVRTGLRRLDTLSVTGALVFTMEYPNASVYEIAGTLNAALRSDSVPKFRITSLRQHTVFLKILSNARCNLWSQTNERISNQTANCLSINQEEL